MQAFARSFRSMLLSHIGVAVASALLLSLMLSSLYWRMCHDAVLTAYPSMLIVKYGILPYRDLFVFNMVGTYGLYCLMGATLGFSDLAFRFTDIALLSLVLLFTYQAQKRYGMKSAVMGAVLFGILYLCDGPKTSMQREFLILLPLSASLWIVHSRRSGWASFLLGVCCGIAASIKPHAVLLWVPVGIYQMTRERHGWRHAGLLVLGSTLPVAGVILMLYSMGTLSSFYEIAVGYLPLHSSLGPHHKLLHGMRERITSSLVEMRLMNGLTYWLIPASINLALAFFPSVSRETRRRALLLLGLIGAGYLYLQVTAQFFPHHWLLVLYPLVLLAVPVSSDDAAVQKLAAYALALALVLHPGFIKIGLMHSVQEESSVHRADELAQFIRQNVKGDESVQVMDWNHGAIHALLMTQRPPALPFVYGFSFEHHASYPFIKALRARFMQSLAVKKPDYLIDFDTSKVYWVSRDEPESAFGDYEAFKASHYDLVKTDGVYRIYKLRDRS